MHDAQATVLNQLKLDPTKLTYRRLASIRFRDILQDMLGLLEWCRSGVRR